MKTISLGDNTNALLGVSARPITIVNKHHGKSGEYIGRGSPLGNPFVIGKHGTREQVIDKYAVWLRQQIDAGNQTVLNELNRLGNKAIDEGTLSLQCFCYPKPCHGNIIKDVIAKAIQPYIEDSK